MRTGLWWDRMGRKRGGATDDKGVRTPWGNAADLRSMKMRPGRGNVPEESDRSQRERLFGAMVALSSEQGYEATKIGDLAKMAGVSRAAFYDHFRDKQECLLGGGRRAGRADDRADRAGRGRGHRRGPGAPGDGSLPRADRETAGGLEDVLRRGLRGGAGGRGRDRARARHLRALRDQPAEPDPGPQGDAAADGAGDARRPPEGDPQAPLQRRSRANCRGSPRRSPTGASPIPHPRARSRARNAGGGNRSPSPSARPSPTRPSGC